MKSTYEIILNTNSFLDHAFLSFIYKHNMECNVLQVKRKVMKFIISAGTATTLYGDTPHFDCSNFPSRGSSYHVNSGGWVVYSEPHYQGKIIIHFAGKIFYLHSCTNVQLGAKVDT